MFEKVFGHFLIFVVRLGGNIFTSHFDFFLIHKLLLHNSTLFYILSFIIITKKICLLIFHFNLLKSCGFYFKNIFIIKDYFENNLDIVLVYAKKKEKTAISYKRDMKKVLIFIKSFFFYIVILKKKPINHFF